MKGKHVGYNFYKGVDLEKVKWVSIYAKKVYLYNTVLELKLIRAFERD